MPVDWSKMSDEEFYANAPGAQPQAPAQSWENSPVNAPSIQTRLSNVEASPENVVFTGNSGMENLPAVLAKKNVENQADINKQRAMMPINVEESAAKAEGDLIAKKNVARQDFNKALQDFLQVDENIPRGDDYYRFIEGAKSLWGSVGQTDMRGILAAKHSSLAKNFRVAIARLREVGALTENEQIAAQSMIPGLFAEKDAVELDRAFLKQMGTALDSNEPSLVKEVIDRWKESPRFNKDKYAQATNKVDVSKYMKRKASLGKFKL